MAPYDDWNKDEDEDDEELQDISVRTLCSITFTSFDGLITAV